jgi:hypothetical protein
MGNDVMDRLNAHLKKERKQQDLSTKAGRLKRNLKSFGKKAAIGAAILGTLGGIGTYYLGKDYVTKRQNYPIRRVLYHTQETMNFAGGEEEFTSRYADRHEETTIQRGSMDGTKLGDPLGYMRYTTNDELMNYRLEDQDKNQIAFASEKREHLQAGPRISGGIDFQELQADLLVGKKGKFITYTFMPERGLENKQLNLLMDDHGELHLMNELVTRRTWGIGWLKGDVFRSGARISEFADTPENKKISAQLIAAIKDYNSHITPSQRQREKLVYEMMSLSEKLERVPVSVSHEDGIIDWLPQESTTYLFSDPSLAERARLLLPQNYKGTNTPRMPENESWSELKSHGIKDGETIKLRVENDWDLWPGNYYGLNKIAFGKAPNLLRPFAHYNNGGYSIMDRRGEVARVEIKDFILYYGDDTLFKYYLDKNGDGRIDEKKELIGQVLFHISQDERKDLEGVIGKGHAKKDVTKRYNYSFMAGSDWETRNEDFYLCNTIESFMMNEINRGYGKHSFLGYVNNQRSAIMMLETRSLPNLARALTNESTLVIKGDHIALMRAAGRDYVDKRVE